MPNPDIRRMQNGTAHYLVSEAANLYRSRERGIISGLSSAAILAGTIVGILTTSASSSAAKSGNTGNATMGTITVTAPADVGVYSVEFTTATTFDVYHPNGSLIGSGATGAAFTKGGLSFTITAGGTPMVKGDGFNITVTKVIGNYVPLALGTSDGSQTVKGILFEDVPKGVADHTRTFSVRDCEVVREQLIYPAGATDGNKATIDAALVALGVIPR